MVEEIENKSKGVSEEKERERERRKDDGEQRRKSRRRTDEEYRVKNIIINFTNKKAMFSTLNNCCNRKYNNKKY